MKSIKIHGIEKPKTCIECPYLSKPEEFPIRDNMYQKVAKCNLHPEDIEDPWREIHYFVSHTCEWCPIEEIEE